MQKLREYYKKLDALIGDIRIFHEEEEQNLKNREKMHREVIPLLAYILASCPGIHDRIDRIYQSYRVDDEETEKLYQEYGVEELARTLTPQARVRYREIVMICLHEDGQTRKQMFKLLKKAQPNACMEGDGSMYLAAVLTAGAFDTHHIAAAWLSLYLGRATMDFTTPSLNAVLGDFADQVRQNLPLPYFQEIPNECELKTGIKFGELLGNIAGYTEMFYYRAAKMTRQVLEKEQKRKKTLSKPPQFPLALQTLPDDPEQFLQPFMQLPKTCMNMMKKALEHPAVADRERGFAGTVWDQDPQAQKEAKQQFDKEQHNNDADHLVFIYNMIAMSGLSIEELYNAEVQPEDLSAVNAACIGREGFDDADWNPDMWRTLCSWEQIAGILVRILARRAMNAENAWEQTLCCMQEAETPTEMGLLEAKNEHPAMQENEEMQTLRVKNRELVARIGEEKDKRRKMEKDAEAANNALSAENAQLREMMEQLLSAQEAEAGSDTDTIDEAGEIEAMKKVIVDAGTIFVCGHPSWRTAMKVEFPQSRFIEPREYSVPQSVFRNANFVVYHLQHANHSMYYKCLDFKNKDAKLLFINQNNVNCCIRQIYEYICQNTKKKEEVKAS